MRAYVRVLFIVIAASVGGGRVWAQQTVGLFTHSPASLDSGYVLFPAPGNVTYLIDKCGHEIHSWPSAYRPNMCAYLLEDGSLLRAGAVGENGIQGGVIERIAWDGTVMWSYALADSLTRQHHDIYPLPNGNVLVLANDMHSTVEALDAGHDTTVFHGMLMSEQIIELKPTGSNAAVVVWKWRAWDHLIQDFDGGKPNYGNVAAHPEKINFNYPVYNLGADDWLHCNSVSYHPDLDQVIISCHNYNEIWIIDHTTTTAEAAAHSGGRQGKGGDLLYRWGNPEAYGQGTPAAKKFFGQHSATWIPKGFSREGAIMIFNNGDRRPGSRYSTVEILNPPVDASGRYNSGTMPFLPGSAAWTYTAPQPTDFFSSAIGGAQMLQNGSVLVCSGTNATFFEIDSSLNKVWEYVSPVGPAGPVEQGTLPTFRNVFRCTFYPAAYPAFAGKKLPPGPPIESKPLTYTCELNVDTTLNGQNGVADAGPLQLQSSLTCYPNPAAMHVEIASPIPAERIDLYNSLGACVRTSRHTTRLSTIDLPTGMYSIVAQSQGKIDARQILIAH